MSLTPIHDCDFTTDGLWLFSAEQYISPSDNIMSPCTAKINALRNKHASKYVSILPSLHHHVRSLTSSLTRAKPKSLFAQASAKKLSSGENPLGARSIQK